MTITAAEPRGKGMTALFLDGEEAVCLDTFVWAGSSFRLGDELSDEQLQALLEESDTRRAQEKALKLLEHRAYSQKELTERVGRVVSREAAERAARHLAEIGLIDDAEYAHLLADELFRRKGYSAGRVLYELNSRGIDRELAERVVGEMAPDPAERLRELLGRKYSRSLSDEKGRQRVVAALRRLGYQWGDICAAMRDFRNEDEGT
jgi:regulatory protein